MRILLSMLVIALAVDVAASDAIVRVANAPGAGTLIVQAFDSPNAFGDFRAPVVQESIRLEDGREVRLTALPAGPVAVIAFVDENDNGLLDKNFIGIPREMLGISNGYRPKGPPAFTRASVSVPAADTLTLEIELYRVLGERGRLGLGVGAVGQSSPYVGSDETVLQPIPAITSNGERLQCVGPNIQYGVLGSGRLRLALSASYRIGAYEEDDSEILAGLGDRDGTLLAGMGLRYELPAGVNLLARYEHDVLGQIGGGQARLRLSKGFQAGIVRFVPQLSLNWLAADLANHDFGVPPPAALPGRPAYAVGDVISVEAGFASFIEITENWRAVLNLTVERFGDDVGNSPIVDTDRVMRGFAALTYVF